MGENAKPMNKKCYLQNVSSHQKSQISENNSFIFNSMNLNYSTEQSHLNTASALNSSSNYIQGFNSLNSLEED
jgi:hypothetical protein